MQAKVGALTVPSGAGNQSYTGLGFTPKVVIFFGNRRSADGGSRNASQNPDQPYYFGAASSSSDQAVFYIRDDFSATTNSASRTTNVIWSVGLSGTNTEGTTNFEADYISHDSDGFTLHWGKGNATAYVVNYLALGGSDLTNAKVVTWTETGSSVFPTNQAVTGAGFQPDAIFFCTENTNDGGAVPGLGYGFAESGGSKAFWTGGWDSVTSWGQYIRTDEVLSTTSGKICREADTVTFDSDGFTLHWTFTPSNTDRGLAICLKGGSYKVVGFNQKTSTGTQSTTGIGFRPAAVFFGSSGVASSTSLQHAASTQIMLAATDGETTRHLIYHSASGGGGSGSGTSVHQYRNDDGTESVAVDGSLVSINADGWTINWTSADATARQIIGIAFGPAIWSYANEQGSHSTSVSSLTFTMTSVQAGSALVAVIELFTAGGVTITGVSDATNGSWTKRGSTITNGSMKAETYVLEHAASGTYNATISFSATTDPSAAVSEIRCTLGDPVYDSANGLGSGNSVSFSLTTTAANTCIIAGLGHGGSTTSITEGTGWSPLYENESASGTPINVQRKEFTSSGSKTVDWVSAGATTTTLVGVAVTPQVASALSVIRVGKPTYRGWGRGWDRGV